MGNDVCDFCSSTMPLWTVLCSKEFWTPPPIMIHYTKDWAACSHCVEFIRAKNIDGLIDYIVSRENFPVSPKFREKLSSLYRDKVFPNIVSITEDGLKTAL